MSGADLRKALLEIAGQLAPITAEQLRSVHFGAWHLQHQVFFISRDQTKAVADVLSNTFQFSGIRQRISREDLAEHSLTRMRLGHSVDTIVADIQTLMSTETFFWEHVRAVQGVRISSRIEFADNVYLDTPQTLPACSSREMLFRIDALGNRMPPEGLQGIILPEAAFVVRLPSTLEEALPTDIGTQNNNDKFTWAHNQLERCFVCIALAGNCAPHDAGQTTWTHLPGYMPSLDGGSAAGGNITFAAVDETFDQHLAKLLHNQSLAMPERDWRAIKLAGLQLIEARKAANLVNRAINLRVAIEIALMHDTGDPNSTTEISHKLAERGAALIGATPEAKFAAFEALKKGYGATSSAIHTGQLNDDKKPVVDELDRNTAAVLRQLISRGKFPVSWNKLVYGIA